MSTTSKSPRPPGRETYSTQELARRAGVSLQTVQRWVDGNLVAAWKTPGGHRRIDVESAERLLAGRSNGLRASSAEPQARIPSAFDAESRSKLQAAAELQLTVLIVEDNDVQRELIELQVGQALPKARVLCARNGFQALIIIGNSSPDIVVTDIVMPHMDGYQMINHLQTQASGSRIPVIIAMSSHSSTQLAAMGKLPATVPVLYRPVLPEQFVAMLRAAADAARLRRTSSVPARP